MQDNWTHEYKSYELAEYHQTFLIIKFKSSKLLIKINVLNDQQSSS